MPSKKKMAKSTQSKRVVSPETRKKISISVRESMNKKAGTDPKEIPLSTTVLFEKLFEQGQRLGMGPKQTKEFLDKKYPGVSFSLSNQTCLELEKKIAFLESQKTLDQNSVDELVKWRNAAAARINQAKRIKQTLIDDMNEEWVEFQKKVNALQKKLDSDLAWYKSIGKVLSKKIDGFKFTGTVVD